MPYASTLNLASNQDIDAKAKPYFISQNIDKEKKDLPII